MSWLTECRCGRAHLHSQISWLLFSSCGAAERRSLARRIYGPDVEQVILDSPIYPRSSLGVAALHLLPGGFLCLMAHGSLSGCRQWGWLKVAIWSQSRPCNLQDGSQQAASEKCRREFRGAGGKGGTAWKWKPGRRTPLLLSHPCQRCRKEGTAACSFGFGKFLVRHEATPLEGKGSICCYLRWSRKQVGFPWNLFSVCWW